MSSATILIVEDDKAVAGEIRLFVEHMGYTVVAITPSGKPVVQALLEYRPDVLLIAATPEQRVDSQTTTQLLQRQSTTPIVYLTRSDDATSTAFIENLPPYSFVRQPLQEHELRIALELAVHKHRIERENQRHYQQQVASVLEDTDHAVIIANCTGTVQHVNALAEKLTGWQQHDAEGHPLDVVLTIAHPTTGQSIQGFAEKICNGSMEAYSDTVLLLTTNANASKTPIHLTITPLHNSSATPSGVIAVFRRNAPPLQPQVQKRQKTEHINDFIDSVTIGIQHINAHGVLLWANQVALDIVGYRKQEYIGHTFTDFCIHPKEVQHILELASAQHEALGNYEIQLRHKNGSICYVLVNANLLLGEDNKPLYTQLFLQDITQNKAMQLAFLQSEKNYREIFANAHDSILVLSPTTGRIVEANPNACSLYGFTYSELIGKSIEQFWATPDECRQKLREIATKKVPAKIDSVQYRKDGSIIQLEVNISFIHYNGQPAIISIGRDMTERKQMEQALVQSETRYRTIVEKQSEFIVQWLPDGTRTFVNESYCRYFQCASEDILNTSFFPLIPPQELARLREKISGLTPDLPYATDEHRNIAPDGSTRWAHWFYQGSFNQEGTLTEILSVGRDITEQKEADIAFRTTEKRYRQVVENAGDCIYTTDKNGFFTYANPASLHMSGYSEEEVLQRRYLDLVSPEYRKRLSLLYIRQFVERRPSMYVEFPFITRSGALEWFGQTSTLIIENDEVTGFHVIGHSINEHRKTEEMLRHNRNQIRSILEASPFPLVLTRMSDQMLLYANRRAIELFGFSPSQSVGYPIRDVYVDKNAKRHLLKTVVRHSYIEDYEVELFNKNNSPFWALLSAQLLDYDGESALLVACNNINARKQAENKIRLLNMTLEERVESRTEQLTLLNKEKDEILAIVAHDLKNPLAGIFMSADLLHRYGSTMSGEAMQRQIALILEASSRMEHIISNLLNINALEAGTLHLEQQDISLDALLEELLPQYVQKAAKKNIAIRSTRNSTALLQADKTAVSQILDNLLSNAIKFSPHGSTIQLHVHTTDDAVLVEVHDEGPGFNKEDMPKLFRKFTRLSAKPTGGEHSTGLGLSIVKKLTEAMHGTVRCENRPSSGARFIVKLPKKHGVK